MVGDEASKLRSMLECVYPMDNGIVRSWEDMMHVWDYTFGETKMNINPKDCKVSICFNPFVPNAPFFCLLKISENRKVLRFFQGVEKGCIGNKLRDHLQILLIILREFIRIN